MVIKMFEEYLSERTQFERIRYDEYLTIFDNRFIKFTDKELEELSTFGRCRDAHTSTPSTSGLKKVVKENVLILTMVEISNTVYADIMGNPVNKKNDITLIVYKLLDEWYYINFSPGAFSKQYKCDGWEGLINCLNFIKTEFRYHKEVGYTLPPIG